MGDVTWPPSLPTSPLIDGYKQTFKKTAIVSNPDLGPSKKRQRFTSAIRPLTWPIYLSSAQQWVDLRTFFEETTCGGIYTFDLVDPITGETITCRFKEDPPAPEPLTYNKFRVVLDLEIMP